MFDSMVNQPGARKENLSRNFKYYMSQVFMIIS